MIAPTLLTLWLLAEAPDVPDAGPSAEEDAELLENLDLLQNLPAVENMELIQTLADDN